MKSKRFKVLGAAAGINFIVGLLYIWSVISKDLISEFGWTSKEASLPYTIATISFVIAMILFGRVQDAKGPRVTATIGGILMGTGLILSGFTTSPIIMVLTFGVICGAGIGTTNVSTTPPTIKWFHPSKKGLVAGTVVAGVGVSSIIFSPIANHLLVTAGVGVSKTFIYIGVAALITSVLFAQMIENPPEGYIPPESVDPKSKAKNNVKDVVDFTWREMLKTKDFYKFLIMFSFSSSAGLMIIGHISTIAKVQVDWEGGFLLVIILAIFNSVGRIAGGTISDKIGRVNLMRAIFIIQAINMVAFSQYTSIALLTMGVAIAGACYGAIFSVFPATISDSYGPKNFGTNYGLIFVGWGAAGIIGPMTAAAIIDSTNSYNAAYLVAFALLVVATLVTLTFKSTKRNTDLADSASNS